MRHLQHTANHDTLPAHYFEHSDVCSIKSNESMLPHPQLSPVNQTATPDSQSSVNHQATMTSAKEFILNMPNEGGINPTSCINSQSSCKMFKAPIKLFFTGT